MAVRTLVVIISLLEGVAKNTRESKEGVELEVGKRVGRNTHSLSRAVISPNALRNTAAVRDDS